MYGNFDNFKQKIKEKTGIELNYYKEKQMKRRIDSLIKEITALLMMIILD